jgi:hypothetical protein
MLAQHGGIPPAARRSSPTNKKGSAGGIQILPFCFLATTEFTECLLIPFRDVVKDRFVRPISKQAGCDVAPKRDS